MIHGVPILLHPGVSPEVDVPRMERAVLEGIYAKGLEDARSQGANDPIDPYVQKAIAATNGIMYLSLIGQLNDYPIPKIPLPKGDGKVFLDLGCNWGRWSHAASKLGYTVFGMDPNPEAVFAAYRVAKQLGHHSNSPKFIVGDARFIPFRDDTDRSGLFLQRASTFCAWRCKTDSARGSPRFESRWKSID